MDQAGIMQYFQLPPPGTLSPFLLSVFMAIGDWRSRRIPNFLTFSGALAGIVFQTVIMGWTGLLLALTGMLLGLALLLLPYIFGGMGAGDVKALAALGAWLGPKAIFSVFCYMGLAGGLMSLGVLIWNGKLWHYLHRGWIFIQNLVLCRSQNVLKETFTPGAELTEGLPYGVAIALGMLIFLWQGNLL